MDDKTVQRKLNQLAKITHELGEEATRRYGSKGLMFYEAEGSFLFLSHYNDSARSEGIVMQSNVFCSMDCGGF